MRLPDSLADTVDFPQVVCDYIDEPLLKFGDDGLHVDPKAGIARHGPRSLGTGRHPTTVQVGVIGTATTIEKSSAWLEKTSQGVLGDEKHPEFPGFDANRGFFSKMSLPSHHAVQISQTELRDVLGIKSKRERFENVVALFSDRLRLLSEQDSVPQYVVVGLPDDVISKCSTVDYADPALGLVHRDLRRAFKAAAMKYRLPTQVLRERTTDGRDKDLPSKIAWNFFTGMYFKAGGVPWSPVGLQPGTCYVGIGFYRPLGQKKKTLQTSLAQAFDEHGEGLVLRGHDFEWDEVREKSKAPHLDEATAHALITMVLDRYEKEMKQPPRRVVVHKTSRYWPAERAGFVAGLRARVRDYDLLALEREQSVRLLTESTRPPLRGTRFSVGDLDFLYTNGFVAALQEFHGMHVPTPIRIADHVGQDTSRLTLLREVLALTKMNWNSARLGGAWPITVRFSRKVAEILREIDPGEEALPQYKFYV